MEFFCFPYSLIEIRFNSLGYIIRRFVMRFVVLICSIFSSLIAGWVQQNSGTTQNLYGVFFVDSLTGWIVGDNGTILFTNDGGNTWNSQTSPVSDPLTAVVMLNDTVGYISVGDTLNASSTGAVLKTTDGGNNWILIDPGTSNALLDIDFVNESTGWVLGAGSSSGATILRTTDGGLTWTNQGSNIFGWFYGIDAITADVAYATGVTFWPSQMGVIYGTTDGGSTWNDQTPGTPPFLREIFFVSPDTGFCVGNQGAIFSTTDGGNTWNALSGNVNVDLDGVYFINSQIGYVSGGNGTVIKTIDGGATFVPETTGVTEHIHDVFFIHNSRGWGVGNGGVIIAKRITTDIVEMSGKEHDLRIIWKENGIFIFSNFKNIRYGTFKIFNNSGRLVKRSVLEIKKGLNRINTVNSIKPGVYFIIVQSGKEMFSMKMEIWR